jgi:NADPH-dependent ferric siderophore reductase
VHDHHDGPPVLVDEPVDEVEEVEEVERVIAIIEVPDVETEPASTSTLRASAARRCAGCTAARHHRLRRRTSQMPSAHCHYPPGEGQAWGAAGSRVARDLRTVLRDERGMLRARAHARGYWLRKGDWILEED